MAAQRAVTESAKAWHAKLAEEFSARLADCSSIATTASTALSA